MEEIFNIPSAQFLVPQFPMEMLKVIQRQPGAQNQECLAEETVGVLVA